MKFKLTIDLDGAAFEGDKAKNEVSSRLKQLREDIEFFGLPSPKSPWYCIIDSNGNSCGHAKVTK